MLWNRITVVYVKLPTRIEKVAIFEALFFLIKPHESKLLFVTAGGGSA